MTIVIQTEEQIMAVETEQIALVTGASSGIGEAAAHQLLEAGFTVYGTSRKAAAGENRNGIVFLPLDVTNDESVAAVVREVLERSGRIDVLVNNAGVGSSGASEESSVAQDQVVFDVNVFGLLRMTKAVLPHMRAQGSGRVINMSSVGGFAPQPFMASYVSSKHAVEGYSESVDHEVREHGVRVLLVEPFNTSTAFDASVVRGDNPLPIYERGRHTFEDILADGMKTGADPAVIAKVIVAAATDPKPKLRYPAGSGAGRISMLRRLVPARIFDKQIRKINQLNGPVKAAEGRSATVSGKYEHAPTETIGVGGTSFSYRQLGPSTGVPVVFLTHLAAVLDNWDPRVVDGIAADRRVITFDNRGVGASSGSTPKTIEEMASDAVTFIRALGLDQVDLFGFSMGGMIAQVIAQQQPRLVRKMILAGTSPAGGDGIDKVTRISYLDTARGLLTRRDPKEFLFFTRTPNGRRAAKEFLARLEERTNDRDKAISVGSFRAQLKAIHRWGQQQPVDLSSIHQPVLVMNGESDRMVPTKNTVDLDRRLPTSQLVVYPDAGHGGVFQFHEDFVKRALEFL
jgi:short-subunit dehydrogenase/pimeloyl-ACP methyl ester carboxylesterase